MAANTLKILVVDDNRSAADALARVLRRQGDTVDAVYDGETAIARISESRPDVVLTDLKMEPVDGIAVLKAARALRPPIEVVVFTAYGAVDVAVRAMRHGARDFLTKPVTVDQVNRRLNDLRGDGPPATVEIPEEQEFIAHSQRSKQLLDDLKRAADVPSPVLLEGEIGSGRGHAAATLHKLSHNLGPFTVFNVGKDEEWPEAGTVFLPNVDDLPEDLQRKLLRMLPHVPPEVRIVGTSGVDGRRAVAEGKLRSELYYALAVVVIEIPPLRERMEDVVPLIHMGLDTFSRRYGRERPELSVSLKEQLTSHAWPGNVRELLNLTERAIVMGAGAFDLNVIDAPPAGLPKIEPGFSLSNYLESVERQILVEALRKTDGDRNQAGRLLGVERNTLRYKLNKYGLLDR